MNPHDYRGAPYCAWCHEGRDPAAKGDPVALCAQCHPPSIMKHPYGRPAKQLPAALPLGEGGRIVCHTCHDPHDVKAHRKGLRLDYQPLCDQCHAGHVKQAQPAPAPSPRVKPAPAPVQPGKPAAGRPATPAR
jgi:predicted CXXCH cytochrome family protein